MVTLTDVTFNKWEEETNCAINKPIIECHVFENNQTWVTGEGVRHKKQDFENFGGTFLRRIILPHSTAEARHKILRRINLIIINVSSFPDLSNLHMFVETNKFYRRVALCCSMTLYSLNGLWCTNCSSDKKYHKKKYKKKKRKKNHLVCLHDHESLGILKKNK